MPLDPLHLATPTDIHTALTSPALQVPAAGAGAPAAASVDVSHSMAWLRATVARFSSGPAHARRRAHATAALAATDPAELRTHAYHLATAALAAATTPDTATAPGAATGRLDVMPELARRVPLTVLATALGATDVPAAVTATLTAAPGYLVPPDPPVAEIDQAVGELVHLLATGHPAARDDEVTANRIALLLQAADATAGLIGNAAPYALDPAHDAHSTEAVLAEVLRFDPPVRLARRVAVRDTTLAGTAVPAGTPVVLHLAEADRAPGAGEVSTFGYGEHRCPGDRHALALAAGVLDALRRGPRRWRTGEVECDPDAHPRVPSYLEIVEIEGDAR
jgi:cytochrome P450